MARIARVVVADVAHHITQRGDGRQFILADDAGRRVYLDLLRRAVGLHGVSVLGYCLMSNHVHVVAIPHRAEGLAAAFHQVMGVTRRTGMWPTPAAGTCGKGGFIPARWRRATCGRRCAMRN